MKKQRPATRRMKKPVQTATGRSGAAKSIQAPSAREVATSHPIASSTSANGQLDIRAELEAIVAERTAELTAVNRLLSDVISRRERVEQSLRETEALTRAIFDTAVDAIITIDERGGICSLNHAAEKLFGYSSDELFGKNIKQLMPEPYASEHDSYLSRYLRTGVPHIIGIGREAMGKRKDGSLFPLDLAVSEVRFGAKRTFTGIVRDLTERKRLEREIMEATEREQRRIGQDLHDGLGQQLTGIGFMTETLSHQLSQDGHPLAADAARITQLVGEAIQQSRGLAHGLYPVEPQPGALAHALRLLSESVAQAYRVKCVMVDGKVPAFEDRTVPTHLYRIAQEAVNNAIRHGKARNIRISLAEDRRGVSLRIRDDGRGIQEEMTDSGAPLGGIGLRTMRHRAHLIGGTLTVRSRKPGVEVVCHLPKRPAIR